MKKKPELSPLGAEIVGALGGFLDALEAGGDLSARYTIRTVELDLRPRSYGPGDVARLRKELKLSQGLFARFLGVSASTVRAWERGAKPPSQMANRFLDEIATSPEHWRNRLRELIVEKTSNPANGRGASPCAT